MIVFENTDMHLLQCLPQTSVLPVLAVVRVVLRFAEEVEGQLLLGSSWSRHLGSEVEG